MRLHPMRTLPVLLAGVAASTTFASAAIAGPSLSGITNTRIQGSVAINTNFGESFSVNGDTSGSGNLGAITPFAATVGLDATEINPTFNGGDPSTNTPPTIAPSGTNALVGNVGTAILAVTFEPAGSSLGQTPADNTQVTATAGLVQLGGSGTIGGTLAFNLPSSLVLNQETNGIPSIILQGTSASDGLIGASITGTQVGPSNLSADLTIVNQLINSLSAF
jgi:hypothetical protein